MLAKWKDGRVTICSANGFVCLQATEAEAIIKLKARGLMLKRAQAVLQREAPAAEWRATFLQAAAATAVALEESMSRAAEVADVENVRSDLGAAVADLKREIAEDRRRDERRQLEIYLAKRAEQMIAVSLSTGLAPGRDLDNAVWAQLLDNSPEGIRLQELREEE
jgi:hypothetical protein